jgi:DNA polymerase III subunit alpha
MAFVHLHVHSQYTLLDGAAELKDLVERTAQLGQEAIALTDRCNLFGAIEFTKAAKEAGLHAVLGAEIAVQPEGISFEDPLGAAGGYDLVFLVEDEQGYRNLCSLITTAIFEGMYYRPRIDLSLLGRHSDGLIVLSGCHKGPVGRALFPRREATRPAVSGPQGAEVGRADDESDRREGMTRARAALGALVALFPEGQAPSRLFLELQDNGLPHQAEINAASRELARELGLRCVVTNAVHYVAAEDAVSQDLLHVIARGQALDADRERVRTDQLYLKSEAEMREIFPDDSAALDLSAELAARCHFKFDFGSYHFPATIPPDVDRDTQANWEFFRDWFPLPLDFDHPPEKRPEKGAGTLNGYFRWFARQGLSRRLLELPAQCAGPYSERLELELDTIVNMGFAAYFLIVSEFINWAKDHGIPVGPGRGSAAGALCAWVMRITDIDPIRFDLLFERFLNPERVSMPDIDVDFCQDRREEVIAHVREKYGRELVSQIITYGKLQAKAAVRDVARAVGLLFNDADRIAKLIPTELSITLEKAMDEPALRDLVEADTRVRRVMCLARRVEGRCRQTGVHAAGVVISDRPLTDYAPLYCVDPSAGPVCQYDGKSAETIGLIKFDFLGLKTLDQIRDSVALIERNTGERIDVARLPLDDLATFKLLQAGDGFGVFQVESSGMRELLVRLRPQNIDEIIALIALYRPGPLKSGMVDDFIDRKQGRKEVSYLDPRLESILHDTFGVVVYQEQVMQTARLLAGYTLGEADLLRRAMGKKKAEEMASQRSRFLEGARTAGVSDTRAGEIFGLLEKFAEYGFNKSHSAAYGIISYQTAWLKAHHRAEFMAALMTIEAADTDKLKEYINDCRRAGLPVRPPDVNESEIGFDVPRSDRGHIRFGLGAVKSVGEGSAANIVAARREGGPFLDMVDFLTRIDLQRSNRRVLENLVKCGAFDWTGVTRRALVDGMDGAMKAASRAQEDRDSGQTSLFGGLGTSEEAQPAYRFPDLPEWSTSQRMAFEKEALGLYISGHPMDSFGDDLKRHVTCAINALSQAHNGGDVAIAGIPMAIKPKKSARGPWGIVVLEDTTGSVECLFFSDCWQRSRDALASGQPLLVAGHVDLRSEVGGEAEIRMRVDSVELVSTVLEKRSREVRLLLSADDLDDDRLEELAALLEANQGPCKVQMEVLLPGIARVLLRLPSPSGVVADEKLRDKLETLFRRQGVARFL